MAQLPNDEGQNVEGARPRGRYTGATLVMGALSGQSGSQPAETPRPEQLSETMPVARPPVEHAHDADEPSIEEYMAALLARTRQYSTAPVHEEKQPVTPPRKEPPTSAPTPVSANPPQTAPTAPTPAPECRTAISELRELANISAQSSFNAHRAQRVVVEMRGKRLVAIVAMITSVGLLMLASSVRSPAYITAVAAVSTACAFSLKYLALGRELASLCADAALQDRPGR